MVSPLKRISDRIAQSEKKFTPSDNLIAEYLLKNYPESFMQNASEIAKKLNINVSTVTRFFPKIGYRNIKEALVDFRNDLQFLINSPLDRLSSQQTDSQDQKDGILVSVMDSDFSNIQSTFNMIDEEMTEKFVQAIVDESRKIFIMGARKEFSLAYYFFHQTFGFRDNTVLLEPNRLISQISEIGSNDMLIIFDFRRYSRNNEMAGRYAKENGAMVTAFSDSIIAPSMKFADMAFLVKTEGMSVYDSYTAAVALINFLFVRIIKTSGHAFKTKYERLEHLYESFDIFSFQRNR